MSYESRDERQTKSNYVLLWFTKSMYFLELYPFLVYFNAYTASLSHLSTVLPESSSRLLPAKRPNHATKSSFDSKSLYLSSLAKGFLMFW